MSDDSASSLLIGRVDTGYVIVVVGRGTCRESAAVHRFASASLRVENCIVTVDLAACDHLDSTFLGCLVQLHKRFGSSLSPRFVVAAAPHKVQKLLMPSRLDTLLAIVDKAPAIRDTLTQLSESDVDQLEMGRHVMECHRLLADLGGPHAAAFAAVADQLGREIIERPQESRP